MNTFAQKIWVVLAMALALSACDWVALVSVSESGERFPPTAFDLGLSDDGRFVVYETEWVDLRDADPSNPQRVDPDNHQPLDPNNPWPLTVLLKDIQTGQLVNVSVSSEGGIANGDTLDATISGDGKYVAFRSDADNFVADDNNNSIDVFVHNRETGQTTRVSVNSSGEEANSYSVTPSISDDGNRIAFLSEATNLSPIDIDGDQDIYIHDRTSGNTSLVNVHSSGTKGICCASDPFISGDGRFVAFQSGANNLVNDDTNNLEDIFLHEVATGLTTRVSVTSEGFEGDRKSNFPSVSDDGRYIAFHSRAKFSADDFDSNPDIFVHDRITGITERISQLNWATDIGGHSISDDGRYVAYITLGGVYNLYIYDRETGTTRQASLTAAGVQANGNTQVPLLSGDARYIAFWSQATNLAAQDVDAEYDVYLRAAPGLSITNVLPSEIAIGETTLVTVTGTGFLGQARIVIDAPQSNVVMVDENTITFEVHVPESQSAGTGDISVLLDGGAPGLLTGSAATCTGCVEFVEE